MGILDKGQKFYHLTVIESGIRNPKGNRLMVKCKCDCGKETLVRQSDLLSGHSKTCGCKKKDNKIRKKRNVVLPVGKRFGKLVIVNNTEIEFNGEDHMVRCKCDCGNETFVNKYKLIHHYKTQCNDCKRKNLLKEGYRQGHLVLVQKLDNDKFKLHCDCGNDVIMSNSTFSHRTYCSKTGCIFKKESSAKMKQRRAEKEIGKKYGRLTVLGTVDSEKQLNSVRTLVRCKCSCGKIIETELRLLKSGMKKSCGCLLSEAATKNQKKSTEAFKKMRIEFIKNHIGKRFGKLTILEAVNPEVRNNKDIFVKCKCDCGKITVKRLYNLKRKGEKATRSCGCLIKKQKK